MFQILYLLCIVPLCSSTNDELVDSSCECGVVNHNRRIVGGSTVQPHRYPWLVALIIGRKLHCGGAIITNLHVLTAGHCITFGVHYRDVTVYAGLHDRLDISQKGRIQLRVVNGVKHPRFTSNAVRDINDIAILTVEKKIKFSDIIRPICLPTEHQKYHNMPLTVAGWGKTQQGALTSSRYLLETTVKAVNINNCMKSVIYKQNLVPDGMMCAYNLGKDACQGDSGGPLFAPYKRPNGTKWYQIGIVSWGIDCAKPDYPGVYTIVAKYVSWILSNTSNGTYCKA